MQTIWQTIWLTIWLALWWAAGPVLAASQATPLVRDAGVLCYEDVPETGAGLVQVLEGYIQAGPARFAGWLDDGRILIRQGGDQTEQLFRVASAGAEPEQLTRLPDSIQYARSVGAGALALLLRDRDGRENFQLYRMDMDSGSLDQLSEGDARHGAVVVSRSGSHAAYYSTRRNGRDFDLYLVELESGQERMLHRGEGIWMPLEWSSDDRALLVLEVISAGQSRPYLMEVDSGRLRRLTPPEHRAAYRDLRFAGGSGGLAVLSDAGRSFMTLFAIEPLTGHTRILAGPDWDVTEMAVSPDGRELAYVVNEDGFGRLHRIDYDSGKRLPLPELPYGVISSPKYDRDGNRLAFDFSSHSVPGDVFVIDLGRQVLARWTDSASALPGTADAAEPELVRFPTFDTADGRRRQIPAWVYRPAGPGPHPVVIEIHGGPESQRRPEFSPVFRFWADRLGIAVIAPNVRGSSGYGRSFLSLDDGERREDAVRDIGALLDWIGGQRDLDSRRVAVHGVSYGGYMALASLMHHGDRLVGGVSVAGISDFVTFLEGTDPYRRDFRRAEYGDERDPAMRAFLERISPYRNADRLQRPLLVVQGANDPRVPPDQSERMIRAMRQAGRRPGYLLARDEGHVFLQRSNRIAMHASVAVFLEDVLELKPIVESGQSGSMARQESEPAATCN